MIEKSEGQYGLRKLIQSIHSKRSPRVISQVKQKQIEEELQLSHEQEEKIKRIEDFEKQNLERQQKMLSRLLCFRNLSRGFHKWRQWAERFTRSIYEMRLRDANERAGKAENQLSFLREARDSAVRRAESAEKRSDEEAAARRNMQEQVDEHTEKLLRKSREEIKVAIDEKRQVLRKLRESEHERSVLESRCEALQEKADMVDSLEETMRTMQEDRLSQQETSDALTWEKAHTAELREQLDHAHTTNQLQIEILSWLLELHSKEPTEQSKVFLSELVSVFKRSKERTLLSDLTMELDE